MSKASSQIDNATYTPKRKKGLIVLGYLFGIIFLLVGVFVVLTSREPAEQQPFTTEESTMWNPQKNTVSKLINNNEYKKIAYAFIYNYFNTINSFEYKTTGQSVVDVLFIKYTQKIDTQVKKVDNAYYSYEKSNSSFVNFLEETYTKNGKVVHSNDEQNYKTYDVDTFHEERTFTVNQKLILGYVFTEASILDATLVAQENDTYSIKYTLDPALSTSYLRKSMKYKGNLADFPVFFKVEFTITMKNDFTPVAFDEEVEYEIQKAIIGASSATQTTHTDFVNFGKNVSIDKKDFFDEQIEKAQK